METLTAQKLIDKLTTRNIIALSVTATFLIVIAQMTFNASSLLVLITDKTEWVVTGAFVFGALVVKWGDIIQFFFRKPQDK